MTRSNMVPIPDNLLARIEAVAAADYTDLAPTVARLLARGLDVEPPRPSPVVARVRPAYASHSVPVLEVDLAKAIDGRREITMANVLDAMGVQPHQRDHSLTARVGRVLARLGWRPVAQRGHGRRERVYRRA